MTATRSLLYDSPHPPFPGLKEYRVPRMTLVLPSPAQPYRPSQPPAKFCETVAEGATVNATAANTGGVGRLHRSVSEKNALGNS